jgi:hypothetical protein
MRFYARPEIRRYSFDGLSRSIPYRRVCRAER